MDQLTHICLIYPREVEVLPHRWNQFRSPPLFPVNGEPFLSRQNRRSGLTETTASFAAPGLPKLKKRVYVLLRKEFLCFLLLAIPGLCSLRYINVCAQQGKNAADRGGGCEMKKADPHSGFFCLPLKAFISVAPFSFTAGKGVNRSQAQLKITLPTSCVEPAQLHHSFWLPKVNSVVPQHWGRSQSWHIGQSHRTHTEHVPSTSLKALMALANRWSSTVSYLMG